MNTIKWIMLVVAFIVAILLGACEDTMTTTVEASQNNQRFEFVHVEGVGSATTNIMVDTETQVMYLVVCDYYGQGIGYSITVMVDAEGKPLLWEGET